MHGLNFATSPLESCEREPSAGDGCVFERVEGLAVGIEADLPARAPTVVFDSAATDQRMDPWCALPEDRTASCRVAA